MENVKKCCRHYELLTQLIELNANAHNAHAHHESVHNRGGGGGGGEGFVVEVAAGDFISMSLVKTRDLVQKAAGGFVVRVVAGDFIFMSVVKTQD